MIRSARTATNRRVLFTVSGSLLVLALAVTLDRGFYERMAADAFFSLTLAGFTIVFISISTRPKLDALQLAALASVLVALQMLVLKMPFKTLPALAMLGMGGFLLVAIRRIWSAGEGSQLLYFALFPPLLLVLISYWGSTLLGITGILHPRTLDLFLYDFDQSLGVQLSCKAGQIVFALPLAHINRGEFVLRVATGGYVCLQQAVASGKKLCSDCLPGVSHHRTARRCVL
jgi:hypothetical protein